VLPYTGRDRQKPSSARPTQLNANTHEAIMASDAKVTMVWTDGITDSVAGNPHILAIHYCPIKARIGGDRY
jgi:hypothetical protein